VVPRLFRRTNRRHEIDEDDRPDGKPVEGSESGERQTPVGPTGVAGSRPRRPESQWRWVSPTISGAPLRRVRGGAPDADRPVPTHRDESGEPTSLPAA
jgi:hypothetical protein